MYYLALTIAFILELIAFAAFAGAGFLLPITYPLQILACILLLTVLILFWSVFMSPRAPKKLMIRHYYVAKFLIYSVSAYTLFQTYDPRFGLLFIGATLVDEAVLFRHNLS